jgi:hypothetical protein
MWIRANQRGRRNLTDFQQVELALGDKADIVLLAKARQATSTGGANPQLVQLPQNSSEAVAPIETREAVATLAGVSHDTLKKVEKILASESPEVIQATRDGDVSIHLASQFIELPPEAQQEALATIAQHDEPAKEVMREAIHNHRAKALT